MSEPIVILISGFARAGKDTLADAIVTLVKRHHPCGIASKHPFARCLKDAANEFLVHLNLFPEMDGNDFHSEAFKTKHRAALVEMGRVARSINVDVFAEKTAYDIENSCEVDYVDSEGPHVYIVPDWRYLNEHKVIKQMLAEQEGYRMVSVRVDTQGVGPANEEELQSLAEIRRNIAVDYEFAFPPNGKDAIERAARDICFQLGLLP